MSRYLRYKRGTDRIVAWLVETAPHVQKRGGRTLIIDASIRIPTHRLTEFAGIVCKADPRVGIPLEILVITQDVINGRAAAAAFFTQLEESKSNTPSARLTRQNASH